jgi:O-antigen ligase
MAYLLLAAVSCLSLVNSAAGPRLRRVAWLLISLGSVWLALQVGQAWELYPVPFADPWFWERFRGWSSNPNQLSLICAVLGLTALYIADSASRPSERIAATACLILPVYVGRLTQSDTFTLALLATGPLFLAVKLPLLLSSNRKLTFQSAAALIAVIALPMLVVAAIPLLASGSFRAENIAMQLAKNNGKSADEEADLRLFLWGEALRRGVDSGLLGLGPGPHLQIPPSIVAGRSATGQLDNVDRHPEQTSAANFEAHNTVLDLFTQGGLIAVVSFLWLMATAFVVACKARMAGLATLLGGLAIYSTTGLIVRSPLIWFAIALGLIAQGAVGKVSASVRGPMPHPLRPREIGHRAYPAGPGAASLRTQGGSRMQGGSRT